MEKVFLNKTTAMYIMGYGTYDESRFDDLMLLAGYEPDKDGNWADMLQQWLHGYEETVKVYERMCRSK